MHNCLEVISPFSPCFYRDDVISDENCIMFHGTFDVRDGFGYRG